MNKLGHWGSACQKRFQTMFFSNIQIYSSASYRPQRNTFTATCAATRYGRSPTPFSRSSPEGQRAGSDLPQPLWGRAGEVAGGWWGGSGRGQPGTAVPQPLPQALGRPGVPAGRAVLPERSGREAARPEGAGVFPG